MTKLVWDKVGERVFETGVDRGVLYLPEGGAVPWNGLTGVSENRSGDSSTPYYLDGVKYLDDQPPNDYAATLNAFTYPNEFNLFDGVAELDYGVYIDNQVPLSFNLSYRTRVGNDESGTDYGYKIHVLYNLTASPTDKAYSAIADTTTPSEFSWDITGVPVMIPGYRPSSHVIIDTRKAPNGSLVYLETSLYGTDDTDPVFLSPSEIINRLSQGTITEPILEFI